MPKVSHGVFLQHHEAWWYPWPITAETIAEVEADDIIEGLPNDLSHGMVYNRPLSLDELREMARDPNGMFRNY